MTRLVHKIICGDCIEAMKELEDNSIDSCVTDPPYGLEFMGKEWDKLWAKRDGLIQNLPDRNYGTNPYLQAKVNKYVAGNEAQEWHYQWATELYRVMKLGAYILVFGGTRTYHRMACAVEDAGFEIKDMIEWIFGSGFPKSLNISLAIDKKLGLQGQRGLGAFNIAGMSAQQIQKAKLYMRTKEDNAKMPAYNEPKSPEAQKWQGWGTGLKPAHEPILLARKPISEHNIAQNVLEWGTGGLNIDGCRVSTDKERRMCGMTDKCGISSFVLGGRSETYTSKGRFPANVILECCCVLFLSLFPTQTL